MTLAVEQRNHIKDLYYSQKMSVSEIAQESNLNWKTVQKYLDQEDFNTDPQTIFKVSEHVSKLDPFKPLIDAWLESDKYAPRKQRHTARRVYNRLCSEVEGFACSYRLVAAYVSSKKKSLRLNRTEGYSPLVHRPGEAQADFGAADFCENGRLYKSAKYLVLSFPHSNAGYMQLNYGENMECLLEGLVAIFKHIGSVPNEIWFDNTKTVVTKIIKGGGREINERFLRFCQHYRIKPVFMNPASGWEKGNVENKVGYLRNNYLVPTPTFASLADKNEKYLELCDADMQREHYDNPGELIKELFDDDKAACHPLPSIPFDTALYTTAKTDKYGRFTLDAGKHRYSVTPEYSLATVYLKITSAEVIVMDDKQQEIVRHRRLYGDEQESMDWVPYLSYISRKPRSLHNSGIYDMMPPTMQSYMDLCEPSKRGRILKVLLELTRQTGLESSIRTVNEAIEFQATDPDSLKTLYRRLFSDTPWLPPLDDSPEVPKQQAIIQQNDLLVLDTALRRNDSK